MQSYLSDPLNIGEFAYPDPPLHPHCAMQRSHISPLEMPSLTMQTMPAYSVPSTYNYCNMPHVSPSTYSIPSSSQPLELHFVEVIHRHHKRTPYASNVFPREEDEWRCNDARIVSYSEGQGVGTSAVKWQTNRDILNPFNHDRGFHGDCQFPQITKGGLEDSKQHGADLRAVYVDQLGFLSSTYNEHDMDFRVTSNSITSQVLGALYAGFYPSSDAIVAIQQPHATDSLMPAYPCPAADDLRRDYYANDPAWSEWLRRPERRALFSRLDTTSGVHPENKAWHETFDHYFDNLTSKQCHSKRLPLSITKPDLDQLFQSGQTDYKLFFSHWSKSKEYAALKFGVWLWEVYARIRQTLQGERKTKYVHNVAHDGSMALLLSLLDFSFDDMVWPGMGAEIVFEVWKGTGHCPIDGEDRILDKRGEAVYVRVLWGGEPLKGFELLSFGAFETWVLDLVGENAEKVVKGCKVTHV